MKMKVLACICLFILISCATSTTPATQDQIRNVPRSQRKGLLVMNFKNNTIKSRAGEFEPWEYGLASMLTTDIEMTGLFNIISKERLKDVVGQQEFQMTGMVDDSNMVEIGKLTAAHYILTGSFMEMSGNLRIESQIFSVEKGIQLGTAQVTGKTDYFFELEKNLFDKVSRFLDVMLSEEELGKVQKNIETKSVQASLNNYKGEIAVEKAEVLKKEGKKKEAKKLINEARTDFKKAIKIDPNYEKAKKNLSKLALAAPPTL
jgi:TolB-like protein